MVVKLKLKCYFVPICSSNLIICLSYGVCQMLLYAESGLYSAETLVLSTLEPCDDADFTLPVNFNIQEHTVYIQCRPHIIIFTASQSISAEQLLYLLGQKERYFVIVFISVLVIFWRGITSRI